MPRPLAFEPQNRPPCKVEHVETHAKSFFEEVWRAAFNSEGAHIGKKATFGGVLAAGNSVLQLGAASRLPLNPKLLLIDPSS